MNSVAICEAALPSDLPIKRQLCRTAAVIDDNINAVSGMVDVLFRRMTQLMKLNRELQSRMRQLEQGAEPATRMELQDIRRKYNAAVEGTAQILQSIKRQINDMSSGKGAESSAAPQIPTAGAPTEGVAAQVAPTTGAPTPQAKFAAPSTSEVTDGRLTLNDLIDAYMTFVLTVPDPTNTNKTIGYLQQKLSAASDPAQAQKLSSLIRALLTDRYETRREEIVKLMQEFANRTTGREVGIRFQPLAKPYTAAIQFQEMLNVLLMAHLAKYGSFSSQNVLGSLIQLRDAVQQFFNNPYAASGQLLDRLRNIPLMYDLPLVAEKLYYLLTDPSPQPAYMPTYRQEILSQITSAIQSVSDVTLPPTTPVAQPGRLSSVYNFFRPRRQAERANQNMRASPKVTPRKEFDMSTLQGGLASSLPVQDMSAR
jgi:uncharacterized protein YukE